MTTLSFVVLERIDRNSEHVDSFEKRLDERVRYHGAWGVFVTMPDGNQFLIDVVREGWQEWCSAAYSADLLELRP